MSSTPRGAVTLTILLLTASPLLRVAVTRLLRAGAATGEAFALHTVMARERELLNAHAEIAPRVAPIPIAATPGGADERALALIARLVPDWSVPIVALGVREGAAESEEAANASSCRRYGALEYLPHGRWTSDSADLCARIAMAARIKILRPLDTAHADPTGRSLSAAPPRSADRAAAPATTTAPTGMIGVVGVSAGGPEALRALLACGVILSGMGQDGVRGLAAIKAGGGRTYGQDAGLSQVYGMPRRAAEAGMLDQIGSPAILGNLLGRAFTGPYYGGAPAAQPRAALEH